MSPTQARRVTFWPLAALLFAVAAIFTGHNPSPQRLSDATTPGAGRVVGPTVGRVNDGKRSASSALVAGSGLTELLSSDKASCNPRQNGSTLLTQSAVNYTRDKGVCDRLEEATVAEKADEGDAEHLPGVPPRPPEITFHLERLNSLPALPDRNAVSIINNAGHGYPGLDFNQSGGFTPPDSNGAAGPVVYVETVNQEIAIFSPKSTGSTEVSDSLQHFFYTQGGLPPSDSSSGLSDPIIIYDELIGRFIVGDQDVDFGSSHLSNFLFAVSKTSTPATLTAADWNFYSISTTESGFDADYPGNFGYNGDAWVFTLNMFSTGVGTTHVLVTSVNAADLAAGVAQASLHFFKHDLTGFSVRPTTMHGSVAGDPMWLVTEHGNNVSIDVIKMTNVLSASPTFTTTNLGVNSYSPVVSPLNPNGTNITSNIDSRILKAAEANNTLVATHAIAASSTEDDARWYIVDVSSGTPTLADQGQVSAGSNTYLTYPAIDINSNGTIGMTYMRSGTDSLTDYMSMYVVGRAPTDAAGTMQTPVLVSAGKGQANYSDFGSGGSRAGDMSGINIDPVNSSFWAVSEYANTEASANWGQAIANFMVPPTPPALSITKTADAATVSTGSSIGFTVTVSNSSAAGTATAAGVSVGDPLPGGTGVSWSISPAYSGPGTCSITGSAPTQTLSCSLGSLAAGASATVHVTSATTSASAGSYPNTATASATNGSSIQASASLTVVAPPSIAKAFSPNSIQLNGTTTLTFTITNPSANTTSENGIAFSDTLTNGLQVASTPNISNTCGGTLTATANSTSISLSGGSITTPGKTCTVVVNVTPTQVGNVSNTTGAVSSTNGGTGAPSNTASLSVCSSSITVTGTADSGAGTLRQAIVDACDGATISFDNAAGHAFDPATGPHTITLTSGELGISKNLTILGPGQSVLTISGNQASRVFNVSNGAVVTLDSLTIANGKVTSGNGGGILNNGTLTLTNSTLSNNNSSVGSTNLGGGIFNSGALTITNSTLSGNSASGGINNNFGGGIFNFLGSTLTITNSTLSANSVSGGSFNEGGGIYNRGTLTITSTTLSGNSASGGSDNEGGGIYNQNGAVTLTNSTVAGNSVPGTFGQGGGIVNNGGTANALNTIIAKNTGVNGPDASGSFTSLGHNLIGIADGFTIGFTNGVNGDQVGSFISPRDPLLGALQNNGGPTMTLALLPGSPAIDHGANAAVTNPPFSGPPFTDQRGTGFNRIVNSTVDIGAFESRGFTISTTSGTPQTTPINTGFAPLVATVASAFSEPVAGGIVTFTAPGSGASAFFPGNVTTLNLTINAGGQVSVTPTANATAGGPYNVVASVLGIATPANFALTNVKGNQNIIFGTHAPASATFGNGFMVAATSSSGLPITYTGTGSCSNIGTAFTMTSGTGTCTVTYSQPGDSNYNPATTVVESVTAQKANQAIGFNAIANHTFGDADFQVNPTANSSLPVTLTPVGQCTVTTPAPGTVHITGAGSCTITAKQAGDTNYSAATDVPQQFTIAKANQTITFAALAGKTFGDADFTVGATASSNLAVSFTASGQCTISTNTVHITGAGSCTITAKQAGDTNFNAATDVPQQFTIAQAATTTAVSSSANPSNLSQSVTFTATVTGVGNTTATGTVIFKDGATAISCANAGGQTLNASGMATCQTSTLTAGTHAITAVYSGDTNFQTSTGTLSPNQVVNNLPLVSFSAANYSVNESDGVVHVLVSRTGDPTVAFNVDYATDDTGASTDCSKLNTSLASSRCDFDTVLGTLKFAANQMQAPIDITIHPDGYTEGPENFTVNLSNATNGAVLINSSSATVTINDSVPPAPNAIDDTSDFVRQQYHDFLNREPDAAGLAFWKQNIDKCNDPAQRAPGLTLAQCIETQRVITSAAFFLSIEFMQTGTFVRSFYVAALNRPVPPLGDGMGFDNMPFFNEWLRDTQAVQRGVIVDPNSNGWQTVLNNNRNAFMQDFVMRAEFIGLYPISDTPTQYINKLYNHALGRTPTTIELNDALSVFGGAATASDPTARGQALLKVTQASDFVSRETSRTFVQIEYFGYLRRNPNDAPDNNFDGYKFWLNKLNQAGGDFLKAEMVKAFIESSEYRNRFGP